MKRKKNAKKSLMEIYIFKRKILNMEVKLYLE